MEHSLGLLDTGYIKQRAALFTRCTVSEGIESEQQTWQNSIDQRYWDLCLTLPTGTSRPCHIGVNSEEINRLSRYVNVRPVGLGAFSLVWYVSHIIPVAPFPSFGP